jgi:hypothetical protein
MKKMFAAAALSAVLLSAVPQRAAAQAEKLKLSDAIQTLTFSGDLRLRDDFRDRRGSVSGVNDVNQQRFRLRFGLEAAMPSDVTAAFRLASGVGEQVSANQTAGHLNSQKQIWIDLAYLQWKPTVAEDAKVRLTGGKMINPLWRTYSSDLLWDEDVTPEGMGESAEWTLKDAGFSVFANGLQMVADQDSNSGKNQYAFSEQAGFSKTLPLDSSLRMAAAYHKWSDENRSSLGQVAIQDGNRRAGGVLLNRFGVGELTAELKSKVMDLPLSVQGTVARNFRARDNGTTIVGPTARDGYQAGVILGAAKTKGTWELAYFKKYAQTDVTVADVADSDFGDGGTNRQGHIVWVAYAPSDWLLLKAKGFVTDVIDRQFAPGDKAVNRLQLDAMVKF